MASHRRLVLTLKALAGATFRHRQRAGRAGVWLLLALSCADRSALAQSVAYRYQKTFGGSNFEYGYAMQVTRDRGYIIGGVTFSYGPPGSVAHWYVAKFSESGQN
jgi:hypothetical protein